MIEYDLQYFGGHGASSSAKGGGGGSANKGLKGDVSFEQNVKASKNSMAVDKMVTFLPDGRVPFNSKKGEIGEYLDRYNISDVVLNTYRDRGGMNTIKKMQDLGYEIQAQYKPNVNPDSKIPPRDYYYFVKKKK